MLVQGITGDPLALGFFGVSYYDSNKARLKLVPIDDRTSLSSFRDSRHTSIRR